MLAALVASLTACEGRDGVRADSAVSNRAAATSSHPSSSLGSGTVYTADEAAGTLSRVDLSSARVTQVPLGVMPHNVQVGAGDSTVLVVGSTGMGGHDEPPERGATGAPKPAGVLLVLPVGAADTVGARRVVIGRSPAHVVVSRDGRHAFATSSAENAVFVVDLATARVVDTIATAAYPHGLRLSPDGRLLYVACVTAGAVSVIDAERMREVTRIPVGRAPVQVGFLPDGSRVYVTLRDEDAVAVVDTRTRRVIARLPVGRNPIQLMATPDGRWVFVANQGTEAQPDSTVSVLATDGNVVTATVPAGRGAHGVAVSRDGSRAFIANTFAGTMTVIDVASRRAIQTIRVGAGAGGISYRP